MVQGLPRRWNEAARRGTIASAAIIRGRGGVDGVAVVAALGVAGGERGVEALRQLRSSTDALGAAASAAPFLGAFLAPGSSLWQKNNFNNFIQIPSSLESSFNPLTNNDASEAS